MKRGDLLGLAGALAAALLLRLGSLGIIHDRGDQIIWAALARHVAANGLAGYTLQHVDSGIAPLSSDLSLMGFWPSEGRGTVVAGLVRSGEGYWDAPLANQPPAFTYVLVASHALLGKEGDQFPLVGRMPRATWTVDEETAIARAAARDPPAGAVRRQLWATLPVLLSELATVALVFLLARRLGGSARTALLAAAIYAFDPLAIFCAHRLLSNPTLATATVATALAYLAAERNPRWAPLAGALAGLACLVKSSAIFLLPAGWRRPSFWIVGALVVLPWSLHAWHLLGHPLGLAWENQKNWLEASSWGRLVTARGPVFYLQVLARSPLVLLGLVVGIESLRRGRTPEERTRRFMALFSLLVLAAALVHSGGKEGRHILHVFPLLAVAASEWLGRVRRHNRFFVVGIVALILVLDARFGLASAFATAAIPP